MSWLSSVLAPRAGSSDSNSSSFWWTSYPVGETYAGVDLTGEAALRTSAVFACIRVRAELLGSVPLMVYRRGPNGEKRRATEHPLYELLHERPNRWQTPFEFRQLMQSHVDQRGNGYALIVTKSDGSISELQPLDPDRMAVYLLNDGTLRYEYTLQDGKVVRLLPDEVFHLRGLTFNGYLGVTPIDYAREAIGRQVAMERANARFHRNDGSPRVALSHPNSLSEDASKRIIAHWNATYGGHENAHKVAVLEEGMDIKVIGLKPEDAQFVESWEGGITDICRWFGVHPRKLFAKSGDSQTYTNVEAAQIEHLTDTGMPMFVRFEQTVSRDLLLPSERGVYYAEFLVDALQRADSVARSTFYEKALASRWMTINEVRQRENLPPIEGGNALARLATPQQPAREPEPEDET